MDYPTHARLFEGSSSAGALDAVARRHIANLGTHTLVQVKAVYGGGAALVGSVDVQPLVHQQDGQGRTTPHGVITGVPYLRIQGGASAIIVDPQVGDIGYVIVSGRDISNVIKDRKASAPGSFRMHSMSDCVYVGGYLNDAPTQYVRVAGGLVELTASGVKASANFAVENGATGSFTTPTGLTVTVRDGIITNIY